MSQPSLSILVITWNSAGVLQPMLDALARQQTEVELVHIDNGSTDESVEVMKRWPGALVQQVNDSNLGFASALKQAVALARGELLFLLNPDARVEVDAISVLVDRLKSNLDVGAVGPKVVTPDGKVELLCARRQPSLAGELVQALGLRSFLAGTRFDLHTFPRESYDIERTVPCLSGAAMMVRRKALDLAGGVDDRLFMYFDDGDICERLRRAGFSLLYAPDAQAVHISASSSARNDQLDSWLAVQAEIATNMFFRVHRGPFEAAAHRVLVALGGAVRAAARAGLRVLGITSTRVPTSGPARLNWALFGRVPEAGDPRRV